MATSCAVDQQHDGAPHTSQEWKSPSGRPHRLILSAPLAAPVSKASVRPSTSAVGPQPRGGMPAHPRTMPRARPPPSQGSGSSRKQQLAPFDVSSTDSQLQGESGCSRSPGLAHSQPSTVTKSSEHMILGKLQRRVYTAFDNDGIELELSIAGSRDLSFASPEDDHGDHSMTLDRFLPLSPGRTKRGSWSLPRRKAMPGGLSIDGRSPNKIKRTLDELAALRRRLEVPIVLASEREKWSMNQAEEHEKQMWASERRSRILMQEIAEARHHVAQVSAVEEFLTVKREADCWFKASPRCLHYREQVCRTEEDERRVREAAMYETKQERYFKIAARWGRLFRGKVAMLRRVVRSALREMQSRLAASVMTVQRIMRGGIARLFVRKVRMGRMMHVVQCATKIQSLFRGLQGRRMSRFIGKMAINSEAHQRLFEAQKAFALFDENGNGLVEVGEIRYALEKLGVVLDEGGVRAFLNGLSTTSYYKKESLFTLVSFVDFCELLHMNASRASAEKMQEAVIIFSRLDSEGKSCLSREQLEGAIKEMVEFTGREVTPTEVKDCLAAVRHMGYGNEVQFEHFVALFGVDTGRQEAVLDEAVDRARKTFEKIDADGSGAIALDELLEGLGEIDIKADPDEMKRMFDEVDEDGSGVIDFLEFCRLIGILNIPRRIRRRFAVKTSETDRLVVEDEGGEVKEKEKQIEDQVPFVEPFDMGDPVVGLPGVCLACVGLRVRQTKAGRQRTDLKRGNGVITQVVLKGKRVLVLHDEGVERFYNVGLKHEYDLCAMHVHLCKTDQERSAFWEAQPHIVADAKQRSLGIEVPKNHTHKRFDHVNRSLAVLKVLAQQDRNGFNNPELHMTKDQLFDALKWQKNTSHLRPTLKAVASQQKSAAGIATLEKMEESAGGLMGAATSRARMSSLLSFGDPAHLVALSPPSDLPSDPPSDPHYQIPGASAFAGPPRATSHHHLDTLATVAETSEIAQGSDPSPVAIVAPELSGRVAPHAPHDESDQRDGHTVVESASVGEAQHAENAGNAGAAGAGSLAACESGADAGVESGAHAGVESGADAGVEEGAHYHRGMLMMPAPEVSDASGKQDGWQSGAAGMEDMGSTSRASSVLTSVPGGELTAIPPAGGELAALPSAVLSSPEFGQGGFGDLRGMASSAERLEWRETEMSSRPVTADGGGGKELRKKRRSRAGSVESVEGGEGHLRNSIGSKAKLLPKSHSFARLIQPPSVRPICVSPSRPKSTGGAGLGAAV